MTPTPKRRKKKPVRCSTKNKTFCGAINDERLVNQAYGVLTKTKGICIENAYNHKTNTQRTRLAYVFGRKKNEWLWLNFCPYCGGNVQ